MSVRRRRRRPEFSVGSVMGPSFSIWFRNIVPFTVMMAIVQVPNIVYTYISLSTWQETMDIQALYTYALLSVVLAQVLTLVATGAVVYGVFEQLSGKAAGFVDCLSVGIRRLLPVLGVGVLVVLIVVLALIPAFILLAIGGLGGGLIGSIPAIMLACMFWVAVPTAVVERPGIIGALKRSRNLTMGGKGTIFLILLLLYVSNWIIGKMLETAFVPGGPVSDEGVAAATQSTSTYVWATVIFSIIWSGLAATTAAVAYYNLRVAKEGANIDDLKQVFA